MAAEIVGGAFLSATLQVLLQTLASREIYDFIRGKKLSDKVLKKLEVTLLSVTTVLDDAEKKQNQNPAVKKWVNELKDAAFDADDILDEIATEAKTSSGKGKNYFSSSFNSYFRNLEKRVAEILDRLEFLAKQKDVLGLKEGILEKQSQIIPTTSLVEASEIYGRNEDKKIIINLLLQVGNFSDNKIRVIPIVGMGGVGKTTLAQIVYNHDIVEKHFDLKAWVHVSQEFNVFRVTKTILEAIGSYSYDTDDLNLLQLKLKDKLLRKKFLLVLDDVWNERYETWDILRKPFQYCAPGSKILVTTRHSSVASMMGTVEAHFLKPLPDKICWLIFAKHALDNGGSSAYANFQKLGREIAKKCKGLPLAAKALGGLLRSKPSVEDWEKILNSEMWDFADDELNIVPALKLSYYYLPSHLKRCFAYCSIFPKGYFYDKEQIILLWMAENFLETSNQNKRLEEVGDEYFSELVSRSFFEKSSIHKSHFVMHDLVNDLAKFVSGEFCSRLEGANSPSILDKTRHLSFVRDLYPLMFSEPLYKAKQSRTFLSLNLLWPLIWPLMLSISQKLPVDLLMRLRCLRVLSLSDCYEIIELPNSIGNLRHLRYLDVSRTSIRELPESTCTLYNLQTLKVSKCASLRMLPKNLHILINLRYLDTSGTPLKEMPMKISKLKSLQMLSTFVLSKKNESTIQELKELPHLRRSLSILKLQNVADAADALEAKMQDKKFLEELKLNWDGTTNSNDSQHEINVLGNLRPHAKLKKLSLHCYRGTKFPDWLGHDSFNNLVYISLNSCMYCCFLPPLGQLPSLKVLDILQFDGLVTIGDEFYGSSSLRPFPSLEILKFICLPAWKKWDFNQDGAFSHLRELHIEDCPSLVGHLPNQLPSLVKLLIKECQELVSPLPKAPAIHKVEIINCDQVLFKEIPSNLQSLKIKGCEVLQSLLKEMEYTEACLESLEISNCSIDMQFPRGNLPNTLRKLMVNNCAKLVFPFDQFHTSLEWLSILESCDSLSFFPLSSFPNLSYLFIKGCMALKSFAFSEEYSQFSSLYSLSIINCSAFVSFSNGGFFAPILLTHLSVSGCENFTSLPKNMHILLPSLQTLVVYNCPKLEHFPEEGLPSGLNTLIIGNCDKLIASRLNWNLLRLTSLKTVNISGNCENMETLPEDGLLPATVTELFIDGFLHLKTINGKGLQHLTALTKLSISMCLQLESLPKEGLPSSLIFLDIWACPLLSQRCQMEKGEDWPTIAHIPYKIIDGKWISSNIPYKIIDGKWIS